MADLQKILNKFNNMGAVAQPLIPDDSQAQAQMKQQGNNDVANHSQIINESVNRMELPDLNLSQNDLYKLAGVDPKPTQRPSPANPTPNSVEEETIEEGDLIIKRSAFNQVMHSAMDDVLWKTQKNPELVPLVQKLYKMATGKDIEYDAQRDSFTIKGKAVAQTQPANKVDFDTFFKKAQADAQRKVAANEETAYKSLFKEFLKMKESKQ